MELRKYQQQISKLCAEKLKELGIVLLALETRTGKTITALEACKIYGAKKVLFVTKKKAIGSILADYTHYANDFELVVINYESVLKFQDNYDVAICDESHSLSAFPKPAKRYKDVKSIVYNIPVILMSATPTPESYSQFYHQFTINKFHSWNKSRNFYEWAKYYVTVKKKYLYKQEINDYSDAKIDLIKQKTDKYIITLTQVEAGFEAKANDVILYADIPGNVHILMDRLKKDKVIYLPDGTGVLADTAVKEMQKIHQICSGTVIDELGNGYIIHRSKAELINKSFPNQPIVIFYKFIMERRILEGEFVGRWTDIPEVFQSGEKEVFLGQFLSAREGIRLDRAKAMIFYNIDFSYLSYAQSRERIMSKERQGVSNVYFIFAKNGIEEKIYQAVQNKSDYTTIFYKNDYGSKITSEDNKGDGSKGLVRCKNPNVQQEWISRFDCIKRPASYTN